MPSEIQVGYEGRLRCAATRKKTGRGVQTDISAEHGGLDEHFSPIELVGAALGACVTGFMAIVAERNGVNLIGMQTQMNLEMTASPKSRIDSVRLTVHIPNGRGLSDGIRKKLEAAANACPVKNSLHSDIRVGMEFVYE